jgi:ABC-type sugar transport system ATPase subunit
VRRALDMVQMAGFGGRRPAQLSGGQQQRIALARALVFEPELVLMDEPLGALDKQLREHMQFEITRLSHALGLTVVYVTHDQSEALTMSDRIAVFNDGVIQQLASPAELYERPENSFVAQFIGENNTLPGRIEAVEGGRATVRLDSGDLIDATPVNAARPGERTLVSIRPERVEFKPEMIPEGAHTIEAEVVEVIYMGDTFRTRLRVAGTRRFHHEEPERGEPAPPAPGERITIGWRRKTPARSTRCETTRQRSPTGRLTMKKTLLATTAALAAMATAAGAQQITVMGWGGAYTQSQVEAYHKPFAAATGVTVNSVDADNPATPIKAQVEANNVTIDVASVEIADAVRLCDEGLVVEIDASTLPAAPDGTPATDDFIAGTLTDCMIPTDVFATAIAYDTTKFPNGGPTTIADFFDTEGFPGKRGLKKGAKTTLEMALMADGVPASEVYALLETEEGVARAFAKLDTIKATPCGGKRARSRRSFWRTARCR